jgi:hypothetical protein
MHDAIIGSFSKVVGSESDDAQVEADLRAAFLSTPQGDDA